MPIPSKVETVWGLLKSKSKVHTPPIILCIFYSPQNLGKNASLINHLTISLQSLLKVHKNGIFVCGNKNHLEISSLLSVDPTLEQIVTKLTYGMKTLDVVITNLSRFYTEPRILPPLLSDDPHNAAPSDDLGVIITPVDKAMRRNSSRKLIKFVQSLPDSLLMD